MSNLSRQFGMQLIAQRLGGEREHMFAKSIGRRWRFDFAWPEVKLAVEVEGGIHKPALIDSKTGKVMPGSRHTSSAGMREDMHKYNAAAIMGWSVLRGDEAMVRTGALLSYVMDFLNGCELPNLQKPKGSKHYVDVRLLD